jgi:hypothetical protein
MKSFCFKLAWLFILAIAGYDIYYSWEWQKYLLEFECNPVAAYIFSVGGIWSAIAYRAGWLAFAGILTKSQTRFSKFITPAWTAGHLLLAVQYCRLMVL